MEYQKLDLSTRIAMRLEQHKIVPSDFEKLRNFNVEPIIWLSAQIRI